ncbi:MAG: tetratricopeptide repeat protein [Gemmataceae bacterium]
MHAFRKVLLLLVFLGLFGWVGYTQVNRLRIERHLRVADEAQHRFDFDKAREEIEACLKLRPKDANLELRLARNFRRSGRYDEAEAHLIHCQELGGETPDSVLEFAMLKAQQGDLLGSQNYLLTALKNDSPESSLILEALAQGAMRIVHLGSAMTYLNQLLAREPDHVRALFWRGQLWEGSARVQEAEADYRKAIELQPDLLGARLQLGELLLGLKRSDEALEQFEHLHDIEPDNPRVILDLAKAHRILGETQQAEELLGELLGRYPQHREGLIQRALIMMDAGDARRAEPLLRRALKRGPYDKEANFQVARCLEMLGHETEAKEYRKRSKEIEDDLRALAKVIERVQKSPNDPELRRQAAVLCLHTGRNGEALKWFQGALQIDPHHKPTHAALADYYEQMGQPDLAEPHRQAADPKTGA